MGLSAIFKMKIWKEGEVALRWLGPTAGKEVLIDYFEALPFLPDLIKSPHK